VTGLDDDLEVAPAAREGDEQEELLGSTAAGDHAQRSGGRDTARARARFTPRPEGKAAR
jgi:hypothetical protein